MLFIENDKTNLIKPKNSKYTNHIMDFNVKHNNKRSFFLNADDWDKFSNYMRDKHPDSLLILEYMAD